MNNINKKEFSKRLYIEIYDTIILQTVERFPSIKDLKFFSLLDSLKFSEYEKCFPLQLFDFFKSLYVDFFDEYSSTNFKNKTIPQIKSFLIEKQLHDDVLAEAYKLVVLITTIPSSSSTAERTFSALKRILTYLRNAQLEERLSGLSLISIEKRLMVKLRDDETFQFYSKVIDDFARKDRRIDLIYKQL